MPDFSTALSPPPSVSRLAGVEREAAARGLWEKISVREPKRLSALGIHDLKAFVAYASGYDPHDGRKPFTGWLVRTYAAGGFRLEDFATAEVVLRSFRKWQSRLLPLARDLNAYSKLSAVSAVVLALEAKESEGTPTTSARAADRLEAIAVRAETNFILERDDGFVIASPLTERASKWWGRGTKWCTSGDKDNAFADYSWHAPLIVMRWPDGRKLQVWACDDREEDTFDLPQLNDETDAYPNEDFIRERWDDIVPVLMSLLARHEAVLGLFPPAMRTREVCMISVGFHGIALRNVPEELRSQEICALALFGRLPSSAEETWLSMAEQTNPYTILNVLKFVPETLRDDEIYLAVFARYPGILPHMPPHLVTRETSLDAVRRCAWVMKNVQHEFMDTEICRIAVDKNPRILEFVPHKFMDDDMRRILPAFRRELERPPF